MRGMPVRQDQVLERDGAHGLRGQPAVAHGVHVVLRRQRLEDRDREDEALLLVRNHLRTRKKNEKRELRI